MNKRPPPRTLSVVGKKQVTPHMLRITLGGHGLDGFPDDRAGGYVKLWLSEANSHDAVPLLRTYTIRRFDASARQLDIDFVIHGPCGPAASWAVGCKAGDSIKVGGPGPAKIVDPTADWFLLAGDMSALPAMAVNMECMPPDARGDAVIEIISDEDRQEIETPGGLDVHWVTNPHPAIENTLLLDAVKRIEWRCGTPSIWVAGEFSQSLAIRRFLKEKRNVPREQMYASSYWQIGKTEDGHRVSKRNLTATVD